MAESQLSIQGRGKVLCRTKSCATFVVGIYHKVTQRKINLSPALKHILSFFIKTLHKVDKIDSDDMTRKLPYPDIISLAIYFTTEAYGHHVIVRTVNEAAPQFHQKSTIKKKESKVCSIFDIVLVSCTELTDFSIMTKI